MVISPKTVFSLEADAHVVVLAKPDKTFRTDQSDSGKHQKRAEESPNRFKTKTNTPAQPKITLTKANIKILRQKKSNYVCDQSLR